MKPREDKIAFISARLKKTKLEDVVEMEKCGTDKWNYLMPPLVVPIETS